MSAFSQRWANTIAARNSMAHSRGSGYGENIYGSKGLAVYGRTAADAWYKEVRNYRYGYGFSMNTGHFTQLVWKGSTRMGIGRATSSSGWTYVVANYYPPGNMKGAFTANVRPPGNYNIATAPTATTTVTTNSTAAITSKKTGLEGEVCDVVNKTQNATCASLSETTFQYLETKKPESLWIVGIVKNSAKRWSDTTKGGFVNWNLTLEKNVDCMVYEFEEPHDEVEAKETVLNEAWI